jgi:hypothetical protein
MYNQRDELVCVTERTALMQRRPAGQSLLPGTGRGTSRRLVEGARRLAQRLRQAPSTTPLRVPVPLPVPMGTDRLARSIATASTPAGIVGSRVGWCHPISRSTSTERRSTPPMLGSSTA